MRKYLLILLGSMLVLFCWAVPDITIRYWFDDDQTNAKQIPAQSADTHIDVDASTLTEGLHTLNMLVSDTDTASMLRCVYFIKNPMAGDGIKYWFDDDTESGGFLSGNDLVTEIDVSAVTDGLHTLNVQTAGVQPSPIRSSMFIKMPQVVGIDHATCVTYIDGKLHASQDVSPDGALVHYEIPLVDIPEGLHTLGVQLVTPSGAASAVYSGYFLRKPTENELSRMRCFYCVDGSDGRMEAGRFDNGDFHFDLDVADVTNGLHSITYLLALEDGNVTEMKTGYFYKIPVGGYGISSYCYWLNDNDSNKVNVDLDKPYEELNLIKLIPFKSEPFNSNSFYFEFDKNGNPHAYARNDFHIRFYSNDDRMVEDVSTFADYTVTQDIVNIREISGSGEIAVPKPYDNNIEWYKFKAEIGDSISLHTNTPCTIQIFDPSGKEVYNVNGYRSTQDDGARVFEDGYCYIAVHDGKNDKDQCLLDFEIISKFTVLDYSPDEVGTAPSDLIVSLFGNGYDHLKSARLHCGANTIEPKHINIPDYARALLKFPINEYTQHGDYDLLLEFDDKGNSEYLTIENAVCVTDPVYGDIQVKMYQDWDVANPFPAYVEITNTGNVQYNYVPLEISWEKRHDLLFWKLCNFQLYSDKEGISPFVISKNFFGDGKEMVNMPFIIPSIAPGEKILFTVGFVGKGHSGPHWYTTVFKPWNLPKNLKWHHNIGGFGPEIKKGAVEVDDYYWDEIFDEKEVSYEDAVNAVDSMLIEADSAYVNDPTQPLGTFDKKKEKKIKYFKEKYRVIKKKKSKPTNSTNPLTPNDSTKPTDPPTTPPSNPNPGSQPGSERPEVPEALDSLNNEKVRDKSQTEHIVIQLYMPWDPNEVLGYLSPAGSRYIKKDLKDVIYAIEFENDPEIANAPAHHIVVTNRIDGSKLNPASFRPRKVKIANKVIDLDGSQNFVVTMDMRPEINVLAQISLNFEQTTGLATWDLLALDPMTLEPTDHYMQGILPVNDESNCGIGEVVYDISLRDGLSDGTSIKNSASIVFDFMPAIETPVWENIIDAVLPVSRVQRAVVANDSTNVLTIQGTDARSGIWHYDIYAREPGSENWALVAEEVTPNEFDEVEIRSAGPVGTELCSVAYDRAGNREEKALAPEATLADYLPGDANNDGMVSIADYTVVVNNILGKPNSNFLFEAADVDCDGQILIADATSITNMVLGKAGSKHLPQTPANRRQTLPRLFSMDDAAVGDDGTALALVSVEDAGRFTSCQFDLDLPEGVEVASVELSADNQAHHHARFVQQGATARIIVYSPSNAPLAPGRLLDIRLNTRSGMQAPATVHLNEAYAVECTPTGVVQHRSAPASAMVSAAQTGHADIDSDGLQIATDGLSIVITSDCRREITVTDIAGHSASYTVAAGVTRIAVPAAGAYIVNDCKIIVK